VGLTASYFSRKHWRFATARNGRRSKTIVEPKPARPGASKAQMEWNKNRIRMDKNHGVKMVKEKHVELIERY
jgi:hypothetical protein